MVFYRVGHRLICAVCMIIIILCVNFAVAAEVRIGSKKFTESVVLADVLVNLCASAGVVALHRQELGGSRLLWDALLSGEIDVYPEYSHTLIDEIFASEGIQGEASLKEALSRRHILISQSLGFQNNYALGMMEQRASRLGIRSVSDLLRYPELSLGFSNEFMERADGWPSLQRVYGMGEGRATGVDHDIAYKALVAGSIDVTDVYSTDAEITHYGIRVLRDDKDFFKGNAAVLLYRADLLEREPRAVSAMLRLEGRLSVEAITAMNEAVRFGQSSEADLARQFVSRTFGSVPGEERPGPMQRILKRTVEHIRLFVFSLIPAVITAIPLGVIAAKRPWLGHAILGGASILQTIPSLALLVFMIPLLGVGEAPAIAALFVYSLLPIIRNTASALTTIPLSITRSAIALGLSPMKRLSLIELPLASPGILAGIKTAAVLNVGGATLGALIGAGGYGQPILTGIRLDNFTLILEGAVPAAVLALAVQALFDASERHIVPKGLRLRQ
jgi:osmoprotectant transport system permease protein